jgi:hypothetical protein
MVTRPNRGQKTLRLVYDHLAVTQRELPPKTTPPTVLDRSKCLGLGVLLGLILGVSLGGLVCLAQLLQAESQLVNRYYHLAPYQDEIRHRHISRLTMLALTHLTHRPILAEGLTTSIGWGKEITDVLLGKHIEPRDLQANAVGIAEAKQQLEQVR